MVVEIKNIGISLKKYLSSKYKDFKDLKREERKRIADELISSGEFDKYPLHDLENMLRINTIDNDCPKNLGTSRSPFYKNESLEEFYKRRQRTEKKIAKILYK